jgi:hypothetical protein
LNKILSSNGDTVENHHLSRTEVHGAAGVARKSVSRSDTCVWDSHCDLQAAARDTSGSKPNEGKIGGVTTSGFNCSTSGFNLSLIKYTELSNVLVKYMRKYNETCGHVFSWKMSSMAIGVIVLLAWVAFLLQTDASGEVEVRQRLIGELINYGFISAFFLYILKECAGVYEEFKYKRMRYGFGHNVMKLSYHLYGEPSAISNDLAIMENSIALEMHGMPLTYTGLVRLCMSLVVTLFLAFMVPSMNSM